MLNHIISNVYVHQFGLSSHAFPPPPSIPRRRFLQRQVQYALTYKFLAPPNPRLHQMLSQSWFNNGSISYLIDDLATGSIFDSGGHALPMESKENHFPRESPFRHPPAPGRYSPPGRSIPNHLPPCRPQMIVPIFSQSWQIFDAICCTNHGASFDGDGVSSTSPFPSSCSRHPEGHSMPFKWVNVTAPPHLGVKSDT
jgi:hypothetical protein